MAVPVPVPVLVALLLLTIDRRLQIRADDRLTRGVLGHRDVDINRLACLQARDCDLVLEHQATALGSRCWLGAKHPKNHHLLPAQHP